MLDQVNLATRSQRPSLLFCVEGKELLQAFAAARPADHSLLEPKDVVHVRSLAFAGIPEWDVFQTTCKNVHPAASCSEMCRRYVRRSDKQKIAEHFHARPVGDSPMPEADYNIAPTTHRPITRHPRSIFQNGAGLSLSRPRKSKLLAKHVLRSFRALE